MVKGRQAGDTGGYRALGSGTASVWQGRRGGGGGAEELWGEDRLLQRSPGGTQQGARPCQSTPLAVLWLQGTHWTF